MSTVVEKEFVWRFVDEVTAGLRQAQSIMEQTLSIFRSAGVVANESTSGLENFGDSAKEMSEKIKNSTNDCKEDINKIKKSVDDLPKNKTTKIDTKANTEGINKAKEEIDKIPSKKTTTLNSKADTNNVKKFNNEVKLAPKERITKLLANAKTSVVNAFKRSVDEVPKEHTTTLKTNPTGESKIKSFGKTLKGTALGMGVYNAAMQVGSAVSNEFAGAISRYDTLNNYPKILESMGASANDANTSMKTLKNGVDGLPTSLDSVANASQRFLPMSKNANDAAKSALALNDAFLASGASSEDASRGLQQYTQMLSSGKVDMQSWRTLEETMPASLKKVSESFGVAGGSAQGLYQKLQSGQISMKELNQRFQELDKGTKGFHETAKTATGGIGTAFENMGNRMKAAIQEAIGGFDKFVQKLTGKSIAGNINDLTAKFSDFGKKAGEAFTSLGNNLKPLTPAFQALGSIIGSVFKGAVKPIQDIGKALGDMFKNVKSSKAFDDISKSLQGIAKHKKAIEDVGKAMGTFVTVLAGLKGTQSVIGILTKIPSAISGIGTAVKAVTKVFSPWQLAIAAIVTVFTQLYQHNAKFRKFVNDIVKAATDFAKKIPKYFNDAKKGVEKFFNGQLKWQKDFKKFVDDLVKNVKNMGKDFKKHFDDMVKTVENWGKSVFNAAKKYINNVKDTISNVIKAVQNIWNSVWSAIKNFFGNIWNGIKSVASSAINAVKNVISNVIKSIQSVWNSIWSAIKDFVGNIWNGIKSTVNGAINAVQSVISSVLNTISSVWHSMWNSMSDFFGGIWDKIKGYAAKGINGVLDVINAGIDGIDAVWKFFTGKETSIHHLKPVKFAQGGIVERSLSMVNDGAGSNWKELIEEPDGNMFMANDRNAVLPLKPGTRVYSGEETHQIMSALGVEHYATGGIVGNDGIRHYKDGGIVNDVIDWGAHELKDFGSWIKDKWDAITKFLKHPIENTKAIISKAITGPLSKLDNSNMVDLGKGVFDKLTKPISDWFKKGLEDVKKKHDQDVEHGSGYFKGGSGVQRWASVIDKVAKDMGVHLSGDQKSRLLRQIATESGGDEKITQQISDVNSAAGHPAQGLLQFIPSTFAHWALPGHTNINSGYDQIMAAINCLNHGGEGGWSNIGNGHGWASGGHITGLDLAWIGDNPEHEEFVINPYAPSARPLLKQAMDRTQAVQPVSQTETASQEKHDSYGERIIKLLEAILMKDNYVNLDDASQRLRNHDAQALRMTNMQRGV